MDRDPMHAQEWVCYRKGTIALIPAETELTDVYLLLGGNLYMISKVPHGQSYFRHSLAMDGEPYITPAACTLQPQRCGSQ